MNFIFNQSTKLDILSKENIETLQVVGNKGSRNGCVLLGDNLKQTLIYFILVTEIKHQTSLLPSIVIVSDEKELTRVKKLFNSLWKILFYNKEMNNTIEFVSSKMIKNEIIKCSNRFKCNEEIISEEYFDDLVQIKRKGMYDINQPYPQSIKPITNDNSEIYSKQYRYCLTIFTKSNPKIDDLFLFHSINSICAKQRWVILSSLE